MEDFEELERFATEAKALNQYEDEIQLCQEQRGCSYDEARDIIRDQRHDLSFDTERSIVASTGSTAERSAVVSLSAKQRRQLAGQQYLVKLDAPFSTESAVQEIAGLPRLPPCHRGKSEEHSEDTTFCEIDGNSKWKLEGCLEQNARTPHFKPVFVRLRRAQKHFCSYSRAPMLGTDTTSPQRRLAADTVPRPEQDEYRVWYFFYGTLNSLESLRVLLPSLQTGESPTIIQLMQASVTGGQLKQVNNGYLGLIDAATMDSTVPVKGGAYLIRHKEDESAPCTHETDAYEVVRCRIIFDSGETVEGCTFRFRGEV